MQAKVLIIEDEPMIAKIIGDKLTREGFHILHSANGRQGLAVALAEQPDLILLDLTLDDISGLETLRRLKDHDATKAMPVVMLIEIELKCEAVACTQAGALGAILKPFKPTQVAKAVHQILAPVAELRASAGRPEGASVLDTQRPQTV